MDELRNTDRPVSSDIAGRESRPVTTQTAAADESGVETIARIPISRSVIIDERQQPLPPSQASTADVTASTSTTDAEAVDGPVPSPARQAVPETRSERQSSVSTPPADASAEQTMGALFPQGELQEFRVRWDQVQASFVDDPRRAVQDADNLVERVVQRIAEQFAEQRAKLEGQWSRGDDATTEELRRGLRQYRAFFERLLSM
jgi:hypothetical protein